MLYKNIIDGRDIVARIEELEADDDRDEEELQQLKEFAEIAAQYSPDWPNGTILIRDDYFETYTQELLEDLGYISKDFPWWIEIDWKATAANVQMDYTHMVLDDEVYWFR